jgi:hypothetical protein
VYSVDSPRSFRLAFFLLNMAHFVISLLFNIHIRQSYVGTIEARAPPPPGLTTN